MIHRCMYIINYDGYSLFAGGSWTGLDYPSLEQAKEKKLFAETLDPWQFSEWVKQEKEDKHLRYLSVSGTG